MKLTDVRKLAVRQQAQFRFPLSGGGDCVVDQHGIVRVPGLDRPPSFSLEDEFQQAAEFRLEKSGTAGRRLSRRELEGLAAAAGSAAAVPDDHDE